MRHIITNDVSPEVRAKIDFANMKIRELKAADRSYNGDEKPLEQYDLIYCCKHCGTEILVGTIWQPYDFRYIVRDLEKYHRLYEYGYETWQVVEAVYPLAEKHNSEAKEFYAKWHNAKKCPVCGGSLHKSKGYFVPNSTLDIHCDLDVGYDEAEELYGGQLGILENDTDEMFDAIRKFREEIETNEQKVAAKSFSESCDVFVPEDTSGKASVVKSNTDGLKKYILTLIRLENSIYSLEQQLSGLYYRRLLNDRDVLLGGKEAEITAKAELEELNNRYQQTVRELDDAKRYQPVVHINYPHKPAQPLYGTPGLFNKKRVLAENEALRVKYEADMDAYNAEYARCKAEEGRLIAEKRAAFLEAAQAKADKEKASFDEAEKEIKKKIKTLSSHPVPAKGIKSILDKEISEAEELLKKTYAARNELYAYNVIFPKYRNAVALSSIYEYLMSERCTTLEGTDGAYNIYEGEIRADRIIEQLDDVVTSLKEIKKYQYMMYDELTKINKELNRMGTTMDKALTAINGIEANTNKMSDYLENISRNSDVMAHNSAVTAYYSKLNAELTNALGYMVAFN